MLSTSSKVLKKIIRFTKFLLIPILIYKRPLTEDTQVVSMIMGARPVSAISKHLQKVFIIQGKPRAAQGSRDEEPEHQR